MWLMLMLLTSLTRRGGRALLRPRVVATPPRRCVAADATLGTAGADPLPLATVCPKHALLRQHTCGAS